MITALSTSPAVQAVHDLNAVHLKQGINFSLHDSGLVQAELTHLQGASAKIFLYGAHVHSLATRGVELLYMGSRSVKFENAITGGISVIYPQFANGGDSSFHGYANRLGWDVTQTSVQEDGTLNITMELKHSDIPKSLTKRLSAKCDLKLITSLSAKGLNQKLEVTTNNPVKLQAGFDTYLRVGDIFATSFDKLPARSLDLNNHGSEKTTTFPNLASETACLFPDHNGQIRMLDEKRNLVVTVDKFHLKDFTIRHPGARKDICIPEVDRPRVICVGAASVLEKINLGNKGVHIFGHRIGFELASK